jgi:hypothetical protein
MSSFHVTKSVSIAAPGILTEVGNMDGLFPEALTSNATGDSAPTCGRVNIMGSIVQDSAPYLFPFIIEYSLIGAAVIYVMWRHIGRSPRSAVLFVPSTLAE